MPYSLSVTCTGANASGQTGAGAGIELTSGNSLFLLGEGEVSATGGNAANGGDGGNGADADWGVYSYWSSTGGTGGHGGGGAGAGIGTRGGNGGNGGAGAPLVLSEWSTAGGGSGSAGQAGATAGGMGELYVAQSFGNLTATGGAAANSSGSAGSAGKGILYDGTSNYSAAGGGGGGGGGFGGAATGIGTGGPGGGGGGGGASSNLDWASSGYYVVKAPGGKGGQNADGTWAAVGAEGIMNHNAIKSGQVKINASGWEDDYWNYDSYVSTQPVGTGGSGGAAGAASTSESAITMTVKLPSQSEWDMVCLQTQTNKSQWTALPLGARKGATIGAAGTTTYYYATGDGSFTNSNAGGSGLTILGTVHIFIPSGNQITCTGANATAPTGGGAGIELTEGNTLYLIGSGKLVATGGNAANGGNGQNGRDASGSENRSWYDIQSGDGGRGGDGGGGAGAGIGTHGGNGGAGGAGGARVSYTLDGTNRLSGNIGNNGDNGGTAADMGTLYIYQIPALTTEIHGGSGGTSSANGGAGGRHALFATSRGDVPYRGTVGGGAGGAGGGFGGAASDIGTGGPGGGGGGGGSSGSIQNHKSNTYFLQVGAFGGAPGANADGTLAGAGESTLMVDVNNLAQTNCIDLSGLENGGWGEDGAGNKYGDNRAAGGSGGTAGAASTSGTYNVVPAIINLADNADNSTVINTAYGFLANVTLSGRTLYKDGKWNTLCLPFDVTISGSVLDDDNVDVRMLDDAEFSDGTLTLNFTDKGAVSKIEAGRPYIIKWDNTGVNLTEQDLVFQGVTIESGTTDKTCDLGDERSITFKGTFSPTVIYEDGTEKTNLYLGSANTLYYPTTEGFALKSCRAYFKLNGLTAGEPSSPSNVRAFSLNFGDEATGIVSIGNGQLTIDNEADAWYSLGGVRLGGKPTQKGVYINNGRKVVIK